MTSDEFNKKYQSYLEPGHYGLCIEDPQFIQWLDNRFQEFIQKYNFTYAQIKIKFGTGRFYCTGLSYDQIKEVEDRITELGDN